VEAELSLVWLLDACNQTEQRGLARAILANKAKHLTRR
jgi:hypothetical protein